MSLTLQINSKDALERLIGGDSELEVELRKSVACAFLNRHWDNLSSDPTVLATLNKTRTDLIQIVSDAVSKEIATMKQDSHWSNRIYSINSEIKSAMDTAVRNKVDELIKTTATECVTKMFSERALNLRIETAMINEFDARVVQVVKDKFTKLSQELLK